MLGHTNSPDQGKSNYIPTIMSELKFYEFNHSSYKYEDLQFYMQERKKEDYNHSVW